MTDDFVECMLLNLAEPSIAVLDLSLSCLICTLESIPMLSSTFFAFVVLAQSLGCLSERVYGCLILNLTSV